MKKNYSPINMGDTKAMDESSWLFARQHGMDGSIRYTVTGSELSSVFNLSPFKSVLDLVDEKKGITHKIKKNYNSAAKDAGHRYEDIIAKEFSMTMNTTLGRNCKLINDTHMYRHGEYLKDEDGFLVIDEETDEPVLRYPFAVANLDRRIILDGREGILEVKTTGALNFNAIEDWKNGIVPVYYELQCRYYMAIMNLDFCYIVCKWGYKVDEVRETDFGFVGTEIAAIKIDRDYDIEDHIMKTAEQFVYELENDIEPDVSDCKAELLLRYYGELYGEGNEYIPSFEIPEDHDETINSLIDINNQISELKKKIKAYEDLKNKHILKLAPLFEEGTKATYSISDDYTAYLTYKTNHITKYDEDKIKADFSEQWVDISKLDSAKFKKLFPNEAKKYTVESEPNPNRSLKINIKKNNKKKEKKEAS